MNHGDRLNDMLDDVLADERLAALKEDLRRRGLVEMAGKRRSRTRIRTLTIAAAAALLFIVFRLILWIDGSGRFIPSDGRPEAGATPPYYVATTPLPSSEVVSTRASVAGADTVRTPGRLDFSVNTRGAAAMVKTIDSRPADRLTDQDILALFPGTPCGLIGKGPGKKSLVFVNPEDRRKYFAEIGG